MSKNKNKPSGGLYIEGDKWIKKITKYDDELCDTLENMSSDELKNRVISSQMNLLESDRKKKNDDRLQKAKIAYDNLDAPYKEIKEFQTAIVNYGMLLLEERGVNLSDEE